jgi:hypothetical protein
MATSNVWDLNAGWEDGFEQTTKPFEESNKLFLDYQKIIDSAYRLDENERTREARIAQENDVNALKSETARWGTRNMRSRIAAEDALTGIPQWETDRTTGEQRRLTETERYERAMRATNDPLVRERLGLGHTKSVASDFDKLYPIDPAEAINMGSRNGFLPAGYSASVSGTNEYGEQMITYTTPTNGEPQKLPRSAFLAMLSDLGKKGTAQLDRREKALDRQLRSQELVENRQMRIDMNAADRSNRLAIAAMNNYGRGGANTYGAGLTLGINGLGGGAAPAFPSAPASLGIDGGGAQMPSIYDIATGSAAAQSAAPSAGTGVQPITPGVQAITPGVQDLGAPVGPPSPVDLYDSQIKQLNAAYLALSARERSDPQNLMAFRARMSELEGLWAQEIEADRMRARARISERLSVPSGRGQTQGGQPIDLFRQLTGGAR